MHRAPALRELLLGRKGSEEEEEQGRRAMRDPGRPTLPSTAGPEVCAALPARPRAPAPPARRRQDGGALVAAGGVRVSAGGGGGGGIGRRAGQGWAAMGRPLGEAAAAARRGGCCVRCGGPLRARLGPGAAAVTELRAGVAGAAAAGELGNRASAGGARHRRRVSAAWGRAVCPSAPGLAPLSL